MKIGRHTKWKKIAGNFLGFFAGFIVNLVSPSLGVTPGKAFKNKFPGGRGEEFLKMIVGGAERGGCFREGAVVVFVAGVGSERPGVGHVDVTLGHFFGVVERL